VLNAAYIRYMRTFVYEYGLELELLNVKC